MSFSRKGHMLYPHDNIQTLTDEELIDKFFESLTQYENNQCNICKHVFELYTSEFEYRAKLKNK